MDPLVRKLGAQLEEQNARLKEVEKLFSDLEGNRKSLFAELVRKSPEKSVAMKEYDAYASKDWKDFIGGLNEAEANRNYERRKYDLMVMAFYAQYSASKLDHTGMRIAGKAEGA